MAVATEVVAVRYEDVVAGTPISVPYPVYEALDIKVYYGLASMVAVHNTDYTITLGDDFDTFTLTPTASLIDKIDALIALDDDEENYITVRRELDYLTDSTAAAVRYTPFTSREFERTVLRFQQLQERLNRALVLSPNFVGDQPLLQLNEIQPGATLIVNDAGDAVEAGPTAVQIAAAEQYAQFVIGIEDEIVLIAENMVPVQTVTSNIDDVTLIADNLALFQAIADMDLSGYYTKSQADILLGAKLPTSERGNLIAFAPNRTALAALDGGTYQAVDLMEAGRKGQFFWDGSDLSAAVAADPEQGVYVAPVGDVSGASGAWVRRYDGPAMVTWFGAHPTNADNTNAYNGAISALPEGETISWPKIDGLWSGSFISDLKPFILKLNRNRFCEAPFSAPSAPYGTPLFQFRGEKELLTTLTQNVQYGDKVITMASTTGLSDGSIIILEDDRVRPSDSTKVNQEIIRVREVVNSTQVKVYDKCRSFQDTGTRNVYLVTPVVGAKIYDGIAEIQDPWDASSPTGHASNAFSIQQGDDCLIQGCEVSNHYGDPQAMRECINSKIINPNVHDGYWPAVGSYGPSVYIGRDVRIEGARVRNARNVADFAQVYCGTLKNMRGYNANGIGLAHNLYGGNILAEDIELIVYGQNYGLNWSTQSISDAATSMIIRDVTVRDLTVITDQAVGGGPQFYALYLQAPYANLIVDGVRFGTTAASTSTGFGATTAIRLTGYPAGPVSIRNVQQISTSNQPVGAQTQGIDALIVMDAPVGVSSRTQYPIFLENFAAMKCHKVVWARGVKHLITTNVTTSVLDGPSVKVVEALNGISNVTNTSIGAHATLN